MAAAPLPSLSHVLRRDGLRARKSWGQNFLTDLALARRIARAGEPTNQTVLEIGAGPGGLTRALLLEGARHVVAVERDERCRPALEEIAAHARQQGQQVTLVFGDALALVRANQLALPEHYQPEHYQIAANLPFQLSSPLLLAWLTASPWPPRWQHATLLVQKEFAPALAAPGGSQYGRLSGAVPALRGAHLLHVSARAFTRRPKGPCRLVQLRPHRRPLAADLAWLQRTTAAAFGQRRKMLRSSLKQLHAEPARVLAALGMDERTRAEELSVAQFCALSNALKKEALQKDGDANKSG